MHKIEWVISVTLFKAGPQSPDVLEYVKIASIAFISRPPAQKTLQDAYINGIANLETVDRYAIVLKRCFSRARNENFCVVSEFSQSASDPIGIVRQSAVVIALGDILGGNKGYTHTPQERFHRLCTARRRAILSRTSMPLPSGPRSDSTLSFKTM
jgi:hypothetical protein